MIRAFFVEFVLPLILFLIVRSLLNNLLTTFRGKRPNNQSQPQTTQVATGGELKKDPVCGTYVSTASSLTRTVNGQVMHFCSKECRDRYKVA